VGRSRHSARPGGLKYNNIDLQRKLGRPIVRNFFMIEELMLTLCGNIALDSLYEAILVIPPSYIEAQYTKVPIEKKS